MYNRSKEGSNSRRRNVQRFFYGTMDPFASTDIDATWTEEEQSAKREEQRNLETRISQKIRDAWISEQMREHRTEFTHSREFSIFIGTWNVNGKKPSESIDAWLRSGPKNAVPDMYAIGFQEMVDLTAGNLMLDSASKERAQLWMDLILERLNLFYKGRSYRLVAERHLVGLMLCVFVSENYVPHIRRSSIQSSSIATGLIGFGNKGGVSIRMQVYNTTICFVCAHLAAHRENVEARNSDFRTIMAKTAFRDDAQTLSYRQCEKRLSALSDLSDLTYDNERVERRTGYAFSDDPITDNESVDIGSGTVLGASPMLSNPSFGIDDHDYVFWLGDFNYRIHTSHSAEYINTCVDAGDIHWLRANDQLLLEQAAGNTFVGYKEGEINFLPSYKFISGTNIYERRPEKKERSPAYCDRILWRDNVDKECNLLQYMSFPSMCSSDHKPIFAVFKTFVDECLEDKRVKVFDEIVKTVDHWENDLIPKINIEPSSISFPEKLVYMEAQNRKIILSNTGGKGVAWRFIKKIGDETICKPWISVKPKYGFLPHGQSAEVELTALVDSKCVSDVCSNAESLDDVIVLHLEGGRDYFVCLSAKMMPTCFGVALSKLVQVPYPFACDPQERDNIMQQRLKVLGKEGSRQPLKLPKELWMLCNFLWTNDLLKVPNVLCGSRGLAEAEKVAYVRRCLDRGHRIKFSSEERIPITHAVACVLIDFLDALPSPVVPYSSFPSAANTSEIRSRSWLKRFLEDLPPISQNVFEYVIAFGRELLSYSAYNNLSSTDVATILSRCLMRPMTVASREDYAGSSGILFGLDKYFAFEDSEAVARESARSLVLQMLSDVPA